MYRKSLLGGLFVMARVTVAAQANNWPQFRGPDGTGLSEGKHARFHVVTVGLRRQDFLPGR
jgi:hypothetical protein